MTMATPVFSAALPAHNEEGNLGPLLQELHETLRALGQPFEIVVVDDGSTDGTWSEIRAAATMLGNIRGERFSRCSGQSAALGRALDLTRGEVIITLDSDGQNDPRDIPMLLEELTPDVDAVLGFRKNRADDRITRVLPSRLANGLIRLLTGAPITDLGCSLRVMRRPFTKRLNPVGEMHRLVPLILHWQGARIREIPVRHNPRRSGRAHYGLSRVPKLLFDLLTLSFLMGGVFFKPMYLFGSFGLTSCAASLLAFGFLIYRKLAFDEFIIQSPLLLFSASAFLIGTVFFMLGLVMEILIRIYSASGDSTRNVVRDAV